MPLGTIPWLKFKPAALGHFPLPPLFPSSLSLNLNLDGEGCPRTCSTEPDSLSSIDSPHQSFCSFFLIGSACVVGVIITKPLMSWYVGGSHNNEVFIKCWSNLSRLFRGIGIRHKVCWENLPLEVWGEIGKRMVSRLDIVTFRSVCKKWRSSLPSPIGRFPLVLPLPPNCDPEFCNKPYAISELNIYRSARYGLTYLQVDQGGIFGITSDLSDRGYLADFQEHSLRAPVCFLRTFSSFIENEADYDKEAHMNPSNFTFFEVISFFTKAYYPCMALDSPKIRRRRQCNEFPKKLVLISSSNADGVNPNYARMSDLSVVAHLGGEMKGRLALLRLGGSHENWVWETDFCSQVFVNIATYKGKLCTLDHSGRVFLMDYDSLKLTQLCAPLSIPFELEGKSLFESNGDLYLVDFKPNGRFDVEVYKLSLKLQMWLKVGFKGCSLFTVVAPFLL